MTNPDKAFEAEYVRSEELKIENEQLRAELRAAVDELRRCRLCSCGREGCQCRRNADAFIAAYDAAHPEPTQERSGSLPSGEAVYGERNGPNGPSGKFS